ncbi:hypothetical protein N1851_024266 [Merluccius polli]|uniref:Uncharacterized protein n=1 Tax=Merluccius polli TaxID=89951 RepID=A0AA47NUM0_MERPO|nr:hypothetical protein N1851_024266 [Merluccius polli]
MPGYCACAGCKNSTKTGHSSMASRRTRQPFDSGFTLSDAHFKEDYDEGDARMVSLGLKTKRLAKLIPTTEPSAQHLSACRYHTERHQESRDATMLIDAAQQETADSFDVNDPIALHL